MGKIHRAIISVSNKSGILEFAKELESFGVEILSTGGTAKLLRENNVKVKDISKYTGFPEMFEGRVKTLHPKIHGGILAIRDKADHAKMMKQHGINEIDLVVVNLYPFEATVAEPSCELETAIENIDIGGPAMLRSAAKNYPYVTAIVDPADYELVLAEMRKTGGVVNKTTNFRLAKKIFQLTSNYDGAISNYLQKK
jgi:phosphoribosylaminoimidazolecarboxamide formyltransferase/IMP cyclohydrolase